MVCPTVIHKALGIVQVASSVGMIFLLGPIFKSNLGMVNYSEPILFWAYRFGFDFGIIERTWDWGD
jgi:hypothetical protein